MSGTIDVATHAGTVPDAAASCIGIERPEPGIAVVTLATPRSRNCLSLAMIDALRGALADLDGDKSVAAIVLAAQGPVFCAGHDLKELTAHRADADGGRAFYQLTMQSCAALMLDVVGCSKPVVAAVQGTATAAGCQLVATCDLAIAADTAQFCTPGVNIGLFCSTPMVALSRNVPRKRAMEMLLLGEMASAEEAAAWGLINRVAPREEVLPEALAMARKIASKPQATVAIGKRAFYDQVERPVADAYTFAADVMVQNMLHAAAEEGINAFIERRAPNWPD